MRSYISTLLSLDPDEPTGRDPGIAITLFPDTYAKEQKPWDGPWTKLTSLLERPSQLRESKEACPLLSGATFGDVRKGDKENGCLRHDANLLDLFVLVGDYDGEVVSVEEAASRLRGHGIEAFFYTSARHTAEKPRWRVLAPLSISQDPQSHRKLMEVLNEALGGILADESFTASQSYYFGRVKGKEYETKRVRGEHCIDEIADQFASAPPQPSETESVSDENADDPFRGLISDEQKEDLRAALEYLGEKGWANNGKRHDWIRIGQALKVLGDTGRDLWIEFSNMGDSPDPEDRLLELFDGFSGERSNWLAILKAAQGEGWTNPASGRRVASGGPDSESQENRSDQGNANLFTRFTGGKLRYVHEQRVWMWWDGEKWTSDEGRVIVHAQALRVAEHYWTKAEQLRRDSRNRTHTPEDRKRLEKLAESNEAWARKCEDISKITPMLEAATRSPEILLSIKLLDTAPTLFGVANGVVDLETGELRAAARDDFVMKRSNVRFNPSAKAPRFERFIREITSQPDGNGGVIARPAMVDFLHKALGYSLTGGTEQQKLFVCTGGGSNGKNVLLDTVKRVMGGYALSIKPELLLESRFGRDPEQASSNAARLAGKRFAVSSESKPGQKFDPGTIKSHTGDSSMTARFLQQNEFEFGISHKLWLMTNSVPALDHLDDAMRGRLHIIPFDMQWNRPGVTERNPDLPDADPRLKEALENEDEGVLSWLVAGAAAYRKNGLNPPAEVVAMTRKYLNDQDVLGKWLEQCEQCELKDGETAGTLFNAFQAWCSGEASDSGYTLRTFGPALKARGIEGKKQKDGMRFCLKPLAWDSLL